MQEDKKCPSTKNHVHVQRYVIACTERAFYGYKINKLGLSFKLAHAPRPRVFSGKKVKLSQYQGRTWKTEHLLKQACREAVCTQAITFIRQTGGR